MGDRPATLPGIRSGTARRRGVNERSVSAVAGQLRELDQYDDWTAAIVTAARTGTGRALDDLNADPSSSKHTIAMVANVHRQLLEAVRPVNALDDAFDKLSDELAAAVRDSATS